MFLTLIMFHSNIMVWGNGVRGFPTVIFLWNIMHFLLYIQRFNFFIWFKAEYMKWVIFKSLDVSHQSFSVAKVLWYAFQSLEPFHWCIMFIHVFSILRVLAYKLQRSSTLVCSKGFTVCCAIHQFCKKFFELLGIQRKLGRQ